MTEIMEETKEKLRKGSYCEVFVKHRTDSLIPDIFGKGGWIKGVVVAAGGKRTRVDIGRKVISKRNAFVRQS